MKGQEVFIVKKRHKQWKIKFSFIEKRIKKKLT